jgi:hypothetical protein
MLRANPQLFHKQSHCDMAMQGTSRRLVSGEMKIVLIEKMNPRWQGLAES